MALSIYSRVLCTFYTSNAIFLSDLARLITTRFRIIRVESNFTRAINSINRLDLRLSRNLTYMVEAFQICYLLNSNAEGRSKGTPMLLIFILCVNLTITHLSRNRGLTISIIDTLLFRLLTSINDCFLSVVLRRVCVNRSEIISTLRGVI